MWWCGGVVAWWRGGGSGSHHAVALVLDGADELREVLQRGADDALVVRHGGADARELELLHAGRQRQLRRAQPCRHHSVTNMSHVTTLPVEWEWREKE